MAGHQYENWPSRRLQAGVYTHNRREPITIDKPNQFIAAVDALTSRKLRQILFGINVLRQRTFLPGSGNLSPANWS